MAHTSPLLCIVCHEHDAIEFQLCLDCCVERPGYSTHRGTADG